MDLSNVLADDEQPISITVKRQGPPVYDGLNQPKPGGFDVVAVTEQASIQPASSRTLQREAGRQTQSTHELFCAPLAIKPDDRLEVRCLKTGAIEVYAVNGRPRDFGTHLEVALVWQPSK